MLICFVRIIVPTTQKLVPCFMSFLDNGKTFRSGASKQITAILLQEFADYRLLKRQTVNRLNDMIFKSKFYC
jgi:hypothetical protein